MGETIDAPAFRDRARDRDSGIDRLARVGHRAAFDQVRDAIADKPGMKAQVAPIADARHHRVGNRADANLDGRSILDIAANVTRNRLLAFRRSAEVAVPPEAFETLTT